MMLIRRYHGGVGTNNYELLAGQERFLYTCQVGQYRAIGQVNITILTKKPGHKYRTMTQTNLFIEQRLAY